MICNVRLDISDEMRRKFKETFGMHPTRRNIKAHVTKSFQRELYPDGAPKEKKKVFKLSRG